MSTSNDMINDAELAKTYITNSTLSDEYKRIYLKLINVSTLATNGISPEEKIQKMTECIQMLAVTQGMYLANIDDKIEKAIEKANSKQCQNCKAMAHANYIEKKENENKLLEEYRKKLGINISIDENGNEIIANKTWIDVFKSMLLKPYIYIVGCLLVVSPYGVEIIKTILQFYAK